MFGNTEVAGRFIERDVGSTEFGQGGGGALIDFGLVEEWTPCRFGAEHDIARDGKVGSDCELLIHHHNTGAASIGWTTRGEGLAVEYEGSGIRLVDTREHFHEGAFPGSVFADEGMNLAGCDTQIYPTECNGSTEVFGYPAKFEERRHSRKVGDQFPPSTACTSGVSMLALVTRTQPVSIMGSISLPRRKSSAVLTPR